MHWNKSSNGKIIKEEMKENEKEYKIGIRKKKKKKKSWTNSYISLRFLLSFCLYIFSHEF